MKDNTAGLILIAGVAFLIGWLSLVGLPKLIGGLLQ
jgi:hypothetical protein